MIEIQPADCLLYRGKGFVSWAIRVKTWSPVSHVEVALNPHFAISARDDGVKVFPLTLVNLYAVLRPTPETPLDFGAAMRWFKTVEGQRYDWTGLFRFFTVGKQSQDKQFCSEVVTRWYRAAGFYPFNNAYDADLVSPGMYLSSPHFTRVWARTADA